jgi:CRISPR/Cas system CMR subunit Cmr4 (Cas7 group RAMP superfamily)
MDLFLLGLSLMKDLFFAIVGAWIGAWLGIRWARREANEQERVRKERIKAQLLSALEFNLKQAEQALDALSKGGQPNFPLDAIKLNALVTDSYGIVSNELWKDIEWGSYQFQHLHDKLTILNTAFLVMSLSNSQQAVANSPLIIAHRTSLEKHAKIITDGTPILIERIKGEIGH